MANAVNFIINGNDLAPPPTAEISLVRNVVASVDGNTYFSDPNNCNFTTDPSTLTGGKYKARFTSGRNSGWITSAMAQQLWTWYEDGAVLTVTTNTTMPALSSHNMKFDYSVSKPLTLVRAVPDGSWWRYDMNLVSV